MIELHKKVTIDLSCLVGLTKLSYDYEIIDYDNECQHISVMNVGLDTYKMYYLDNDKLLVDFNNQWYFLHLRYEYTPTTEEEHDKIIERLSQDTISFKHDLGIMNFKSLTNGELLYTIEQIKQSCEDTFIGTEADVLINIFNSEHEQMINMFVDDKLLMYVGVEIKQEQIL